MVSTEAGAAVGGDGQNRPVWVQLDSLCIRRPDAPASTPNTRHALDMTAQAIGILHHWLWYGKGDWLGLVSYHVPFADGRKEQLIWSASCACLRSATRKYEAPHRRKQYSSYSPLRSRLHISSGSEATDWECGVVHDVPTGGAEHSVVHVARSPAQSVEICLVNVAGARHHNDRLQDSSDSVGYGFRVVDGAERELHVRRVIGKQVDQQWPYAVQRVVVPQGASVDSSSTHGELDMHEGTGRVVEVARPHAPRPAANVQLQVRLVLPRSMLHKALGC
jgi:hypothetical protein